MQFSGKVKTFLWIARKNFAWKWKSYDRKIRRIIFLGGYILGRISKVSSFASRNERKLKFPTPLKKEIAHLYNPLCSTRTQTCIKSRIFGLVKIFLQDSACTFPSYCMHCCVCVCVIPTWNRVVRSPLVYSTRSFLSLSLHFLQPLLERSLRKRGPLKLHGSWDFSRYFFFFFLFSKIARAIIRHRKRVINKRSIDIYRNVN